MLVQLVLSLLDSTMNITPIPAFSDNYIWAIANETDAWLVDPGQYAPASQYLKQKHLRLAGILLTHHHPDHQGGVPEFLAEQVIPVVGPSAKNIPVVTHAVGQGDQILLEPFDLTLNVLEVPGHTLEHIAFFGNIANVPRLFCGDTLFAGGCGRLLEGTAAQMWQSLIKLSALSAQTQVYCAHEYTLSNLKFARLVDPDNKALKNRLICAEHTRARGQPTLPSTIELEKATNPFLRAGHPALIASAANFLQEPILDVVQSFATLRKWKDKVML